MLEKKKNKIVDEMIGAKLPLCANVCNGLRLTRAALRQYSHLMPSFPGSEALTHIKLLMNLNKRMNFGFLI